MFAGCDLGSVTARVVIIEDGAIVSSETMPYKKLPVQAAVEAFEKALSKGGLSQDQVDFCVATGFGKKAVPYANGLSVGAGSAGSDMIGTINGEEATASGQVLTGADGTAAEGLSLEVDMGAFGNLGSINFGRGLFSQLDDMLDQFLVADGLLDNRSTGLQDRIDDISDQRVALQSRLETIEARYRSQFGSLDLLLSQLQSTSDFLTQQLASLPGAAFQPDS